MGFTATIDTDKKYRYLASEDPDHSEDVVLWLDRRGEKGGAMNGVIMPAPGLHKKYHLLDLGWFCFNTLERPWFGNQRNLSCIPAGTYRLKRRTHGGYYKRYKKRWGHEYSIEIADVPNRGDILTHTGNWVNDTRGCVIVGIPPGTGLHKSKAFVGDSRNVYQEIYNWTHDVYEKLDGQDIWLRIDDPEGMEVEAEHDIDREDL